ncbi:MAG: LacI family DNA-binding transcriptional regulator [Nocardioidaceae bacterium]
MRDVTGDRSAAVNIRDVAAAAGVSAATVSRVLNPEAAAYPVRPETRERVLEAIERLRYRPNDLARALLHRRTNVVGLIVPDISNPYYPEVARGIEDVASTAGWRVVLCNTDRDIEKTTTYLDTLIKTRADGVIVVGGSTSEALAPNIFEPYDTRIVLVGRHELPYPSVQIDNVAAAHEATAHVLRLGHRRVAFLGGPHASRTVQDRLAGYRQALEDAGVAFAERLVREGDFQEASGYATAGGLLGLPDPPTAIIAANDRMAFGAHAAAVDHGLRVPDDVSLVGFDDVSLASYLRPALTTVAIPSYEIGERAMRILLAEDPADPAGGGAEPSTLATKLVVRDSCAPPP